MAALLPVIASVCLGPVYVKKERDKYSHVQSETLSLTDRVFQDKSSKQLVNFVKHPWQPDDVRLTDYLYINPLPIQTALDPRAVIHEYRKMMKEHVERRILFFFQQMIVCYQSKLHFESVGAQDQVDSAEAIYTKTGEEHTYYSERNAAHSAGNPCIVAYDPVQWKEYQEGKRAKPEGYVYLKGSDSYRTANSTMNMPKWMNIADREIDEKTAHSLLRKKGEDILNCGAQGGLTPDQGMLEYLDVALYEVQAAKQRLVLARKDEEVQLVLDYYERYLTKFKRIIRTDPFFLEKFLGLMMGDTTLDQSSKKIIFQMRYAAIRNCQINQAALIQKITAVKKRVLDAIKEVSGRKPDNFDAAFKTIIIALARTDDDRHRLEKLMNFSPENFLPQLAKREETIFNKTVDKVLGYITDITFVIREVLQDMRHLSTQEMYDRAQTIKTLRAMKHWTQVQLGNEVKELFPHAAASQSTISRIERREKLVTAPIAQEFSRVFGVDSGLFMPHFFYA